MSELPEPFGRVYRRFRSVCPVWGNYTTELSLEAIIELDAHQGVGDGLEFALKIRHARGEKPQTQRSYLEQAFCCLEDALWRATGEPAYLKAMTATTLEWKALAARDDNGLVLHERKNEPPRLLLDGSQEYAARCIRVGVWSGEDSLVDEGIAQWIGLARILRSHQDGLWSQGRGWLEDPAALSPGYWSRGQAWVLRGLWRSFELLPGNHPGAAALRQLLLEHLDALLAAQAPDGFWHRLPLRPTADSCPDSSATAMIYRYVSDARSSFVELETERWGVALARALLALNAVVDAGGRVGQSCPGPGPLWSEDDYIGNRIPSPMDEPHGAFAMLLAAKAVLDRVASGDLRESGAGVNSLSPKQEAAG
jgi:rhamnogalacturonyl hydrolase YesR